MQFTNEFQVQAPLQSVWDLVLDAEQVAPCVPGAQITEIVDRAHYKGTVKVKLGAVQMTYRGEMEVSPDETARAITLVGKGKETKGTGSATGTFRVQLSEPRAGHTHVHITTDVDVTGKVAQFSRGILPDVAGRLIREFSQCLEQKLEQSQPSPVQQTVSEERLQTPPAPLEPVPLVSQPEVESRMAPTPASRAHTEGMDLRLSKLIVDVTRGRLARVLHAVADRIEPA